MMTLLKSWIEIPRDSDFTLYNIPYGIGEIEPGKTGALTRIGDTLVSLEALGELGLLAKQPFYSPGFFRSDTLNGFISLSKEVHRKFRARLQEIFSDQTADVELREKIIKAACRPSNTVKMQMPVKVTDYTDFYSSIEHATNVGKMFRDPDNALLPNWKHLPVGYHGRASSIVISGTDFHRPKGQTKPAEADSPVFGPTRMLDFELEMAFVVSRKTQLGESVPVEKAEDHIFGFLLFNDLSARDIQSWEYVPLGPFLSKNFASVVSPWIVTLEALDPFRVKGPEQKPEVLDYLKIDGRRNFDIQLEVAIRPAGSAETVVTRSNFKYMYWNINQQLAHHTVNGCNITPGDLYASGTISGDEPDSFGSMLELTWRGARPIRMNDGTERKFLNDGDTVILRGFAGEGEKRVGFGECITKVLPAKE